MGWAVAEIIHRTSIYQFKLIIMGNPKNLAMYAIIDASSVETKTSDFIQRMVAKYDRERYAGIKLCQHGESKILLFEITSQPESVVKLIHSLAEMYSLYPAYVFETGEDSCHLKEAKYQSYSVEQAVMVFDVLPGGIAEWKKNAVGLMKKIYREDSVFLKVFVCEHEGIVYVTAYNSERDPKYRGEVIGVSGWKAAVEKFAKTLGGSIEFQQVRYANL